MTWQKAIQQKMRKKGLEVFLLVNTGQKDPNIFYATGLDIEYCMLVVPKTNQPIFLVPALEYEKAKRWSKIKKIIQYKTKEDIKKIVGKKKTVGINATQISLATYKELRTQLKGCRFKAADTLWKSVRIKKNADEIKKLKKAAEIGDRIFQELCSLLQKNKRHFKTEKDIASFIEEQAKKYDATLSFDPIVASGKNAAIPHYHPQKIPIQKGFCVLDFGVRYQGYISDMTRTIFFGHPTQKERGWYEKVLQAQREAMGAIKNGVSTKKVDAISRKKIDYPHGLGHGIGVEVHEAPALSPKSKEYLQEGMCFTIEPGSYDTKKGGIRIEDEVWLTKKGPIPLTKSSKKLFCF